MRLEPFWDMVLLERMPEEKVSAGGIIIPLAAQARSQQCTVVAVGQGRLMQDGSIIPLQIKPGDEVLVGKFAGEEFDFDGRTFLLVQERAVHGRVTDG